MAAAQPFLSGAISKTVNMPNTATVEDIADAYIQGWKYGLKALAIYRDGSKTAQALRTDAQESADLEGKVVLTQEEFDKQLETARAEGAKVAGQTPHRRRMPVERQSLTHKFSIAGHEGYITAGQYDDGTPGEIFLTDIGKEGSTLRGMMNAFATSISVGLQYGVPLETFVDKFSYMRFEPEGMTKNKEIPFAKSMPDYIMRWLASRYCDADLQEELGIMTEAVRAKKSGEEASVEQRGDTAGPVAASNGVTNGNGAKKVEAASAGLINDAPVAAPAKLKGLDLGPACGQCGGMMQRTGSCYTCSSCGNNTGCG
jgi:ribonucleoside-diphosphate reductase alpha chain